MIAEVKYKMQFRQIVTYIIKKSQIFREYPLCHSRPDRSLSYQGYYFALCARCTAIYIGGLLTIIAVPFWSRYLLGGWWTVIGSFLLVPSGIDGTTQMFAERESTNRLRVLTGCLLGIGIPLILWGCIAVAGKIL